jgi:hypothetical protein
MLPEEVAGTTPDYFTDFNDKRSGVTDWANAGHSRGTV